MKGIRFIILDLVAAVTCMLFRQKLKKEDKDFIKLT